MTQYDYKVVPAPRRAKKIRGIKGTEELFAHTLTDAINEVARQGWEYVRAEHLPAEGPRGWFRSAAAGEQTVLVFRRARDAMGPRLAASHEAGFDVEPAPVMATERVVRAEPAPRHREPSLRIEPLPPSEAVDPFPTPLRPPRIGPADQG
ncbi:MAG: DUF4177 domain-containing protein [Amaricoccus sp.]